MSIFGNTQNCVRMLWTWARGFSYYDAAGTVIETLTLPGFVYVARLPSAPFPPGTIAMICESATQWECA
jgi:hypothetical protein